MWHQTRPRPRRPDDPGTARAGTRARFRFQIAADRPRDRSGVYRRRTASVRLHVLNSFLGVGVRRERLARGSDHLPVRCPQPPTVVPAFIPVDLELPHHRPLPAAITGRKSRGRSRPTPGVGPDRSYCSALASFDASRSNPDLRGCPARRS